VNICGIIVAAGSGSRMHTKKNKVLMKFGRDSALARCITAHRNTGLFSELIIVCRKEDKKTVSDIARRYAGTLKYRLIEGGKERQDSVCNALAVLGEDTDLISVHDAARCFVTEDLIRACVECAKEYGSAVPVSPVTDTVKMVDGDIVEKTLNRNVLKLVQTPQVFSAKLLIDAYEAAYSEGYYGTDDASLVERTGAEVHILEGNTDNIKLTTKEDIAKGRSIAGGRADAMRIGNGFDVHAFTEGRPLVLGGVEIPFEKGLEGHSDADVLLHAIMDALLGACGLPDIGELFPPGAAQYRNISSMILLERVKKKMDDRYCSVINVDATLIMQAPKIARYKDKMARNIAGVLGIQPEQVNIKGTTTEKLGFVGREEGIAASAVCLVRMR